MTKSAPEAVLRGLALKLGFVVLGLKNQHPATRRVVEGTPLLQCDLLSTVVRFYASSMFIASIPGPDTHTLMKLWSLKVNLYVPRVILGSKK